MSDLDPVLDIAEDTEEDTVLRVAWAEYGRAAQTDICIEKMAELTHALLTARRDGLEWTQGIVEELADVLVCLQQLKTQLSDTPLTALYRTHVTDKTLWDLVCSTRSQKIERLNDRLIDHVCEKEHLRRRHSDD
jgi:hypothetical protein